MAISRPPSVSVPRLPELKMDVHLGRSAEKVAGNLVVWVAGRILVERCQSNQSIF